MISPAPPASLPSHFVHLGGFDHRIFVDICSGRHAPLSNAAIQCHVNACPVDILRNPAHDLLNDGFFEDLLRLCASG